MNMVEPEREDVEEVELQKLREGERVLMQYHSTQSGNTVQHEGVVEEAERMGDRTTEIKFRSDEGRLYTAHRRVYSTGDKERRLSRYKPDFYLIEALDLEQYEEKIVVGAVQITKEKSRVFDCPECGSHSAAVKGIKEHDISLKEVLTITCSSCRREMQVDDKPTMMALKVQK